MRFAPVLYAISWILLPLGGAMLVPALVDGASGNPDWFVFTISAAATVFVAITVNLATRGGHAGLLRDEAFLFTAGVWIAVPAFGTLPLLLSDLGLTFTDAWFETVSGLTTTGSTVLTGLDSMPPGILLWRAILQWIGGVGIVAIGIAVLPFLKVGGMQLFHLESSDSTEKIVPQTRLLMTGLLAVYVGLTAVCAVLYALAGMTVFEAVVHAMTTLSTGGYSTADRSIGAFESPAIEWIAIVFMAAGSLPFVLYVQTLRGRLDALFHDGQVRTFLIFLLFATSGVALWLIAVDSFPIRTAFREAAFHVVSVVTTTGYVVSDYSTWGSMPFGVFFALLFIGGCTGSTAGGIKIFRFEVIGRIIAHYLWGRVYPNGIRILRYRERLIEPDALSGILVFVLVYMLTVAATSVVLETHGLDLVTSLSAAATAVGNVGPGLGDLVGPSGTFQPLPDGAKWVLSIAMLFGRLEMLALLVVMSPAFWRR